MIGPFFDRTFDFVQTLQRELRPKEIVVGIDPGTVSMPEFGHQRADWRFVDVSHLAKSSGYLHAKALYIEALLGEKWLFTGSANPSKPAWHAPPESRNAEAVIMHSGESASVNAQQFGIADIKTLPALSETRCTEIGARLRLRAGKEPSDTTRKCLIGIAKKAAIEISRSAFSFEEFRQAKCFDEYQTQIGIVDDYQLSDDLITIQIGEDVSKVRFLELLLKNEEILVCLVHHSEEIKRRSMNTRQVQFRRSLEALQEGSPDIENLIMTIEKVIFDEPFEVDSATKLRRISGKKSAESDTTQELTTLSVNLVETKRQRNLRKRMVQSGDIGHLLDLLTHRLGEGLENKERLPAKIDAPSEEDLVGADDDEPELRIETLDTPKLVTSQ